MIVLRILLLPLALLYGFAVLARNKFYDWNILPSKAFSIPVICVGNISMGGTGKTPMVEYLTRLLQDRLRVATLSRGYGRKTKGFVLAGRDSSYKEIGDEPAQYKYKFPGLTVAVCEKRVPAIEKLMSCSFPPEIVLLDDAFQHRAVSAGLNILLLEYSRFSAFDFLFPSGTLREWKSGIGRAGIIVVTKCPENISPGMRKEITDSLRLRSHQRIYFSFPGYEPPVAFTAMAKTVQPRKSFHVLLVTGIARPEIPEAHLRSCYRNVTHIKYSDHHPYTSRDVEKIEKSFLALESQEKILITTEKDLMRLLPADTNKVLDALPCFTLPVRICFPEPDKNSFDRDILGYAGEAQGTKAS